MEISQQNLIKELEICRKEISKLKIENDELSNNLFAVNEKLKDSEKLKGHFISNITNEIINPFTSILALSENIEKLKDGQLPQAKRLAELIFQEAFQLDFQLKNIFNAASIEAGTEEIKPVKIDLIDFGGQIKSYFRKQLSRQSIMLLINYENETEASNSFISDREKLEAITKNLISNSIKFSPAGSEIKLRFNYSLNELLIEVSDQGKGIQAKDRKVIFDRFKQLDERINSINTGHGLGLSIIQAYTEMLGGKVQIDDNTGGGVKISVTIPEFTATAERDDLEDFLFDSEAIF